ncbi:MAG: putative sulfate exporter family transporter [Deltaproteobacteria bacterium CG07_land_8_20_14_0_80_60_11]|nr:MAG: putative sulfate exporter family transporter [Deltaproteobacteria bacterium CG07_land_8_20_14_0_80_60_11]
MEGKKGISEDWLSLWIGLCIFVLGLGLFAGLDLLGWGVKTSVWTDITKALSPVSGTLKGMPGLTSLLLTYVFMLVIMEIGAIVMGVNVGRFMLGFTLVFWIGFGCWLLGHFGYIAATDAAKAGIGWSLKLTGEAGFIVALIVGLIVGNFFTKLAGTLQEATRPELYVKTAIVIMGAGLGVKAAEAAGLASAVLFAGLCAIIVAYLIYWAVVYFVARKYFKFSREWAAPLASGISICGVSAAIATGGAIRARPVVAIMVSSLVVIFAVVELILLPFVAQFFLWTEPMVAGAWMALAVKTDGAAVASGAIVDSLIRAKALAVQGINYKEGWILMTATTVKVFIDVFIGVWAFILAIIWCAKIECTGGRIKAIEIWERFPKFVIGYVITFLIMLFACLGSPNILKTAKAATAEMDIFRGIFFVLTFFTIGVVSNFKKLWEEGIGRLAAVYVLCLFGFIIWVGLLISWLFFHGVKPPLAS